MLAWLSFIVLLGLIVGTAGLLWGAWWAIRVRMEEGVWPMSQITLAIEIVVVVLLIAGIISGSRAFVRWLKRAPKDPRTGLQRRIDELTKRRTR